jgi:DedD protein
MATSANSDASEVKRRGRQRLIGAIAIAVLLVVFVPMVLDSEPKSPKSGPALDIPPQDKAAPLPAPTVPAKAPPAAPKAEAPAPAPAPSNPAPAPSKPAPAPSKSTATVTPKLEGFAVQVGAFKEDDKLAHARDKLVAAKVSHYVERVQTGSGELKRLRAGPFPNREAADKALATIKAASLDGKVVPLP